MTMQHFLSVSEDDREGEEGEEREMGDDDVIDDTVRNITSTIFMMGPDKPAIPGLWLFQAY